MTDRAATVRNRRQAASETDRNYAAHWQHVRASVAEARDGDRRLGIVQYLRGVYHLVLATGWALIMLVWLPLELAWRVGCFAWAQATGWARNVRGYAALAEWEDFVPPSVESTVKWFVQIIPKAFGSGTAYEQLRANVVLFGVTAAASLVTGGIALVIELLWVTLGAYALFFRTTPEGDRLHRRALASAGDALSPVLFWRSTSSGSSSGGRSR